MFIYRYDYKSNNKDDRKIYHFYAASRVEADKQFKEKFKEEPKFFVGRSND